MRGFPEYCIYFGFFYEKKENRPDYKKKQTLTIMKKVICSQKAPGAIGPYSQAIEAGGMVFVSGQLPIDAATGVMAEGAEAQARQSLENIKHILEEAGLGMANIVKTTVFLADMSLFADMNKVYATYFDGAFPARSAVAVKALPKDALVEIECIAVR
jgi:putative endoribonuclease L-PSP